MAKQYSITKEKEVKILCTIWSTLCKNGSKNIKRIGLKNGNVLGVGIASYFRKLTLWSSGSLRYSSLSKYSSNSMSEAVISEIHITSKIKSCDK